MTNLEVDSVNQPDLPEPTHQAIRDALSRSGYLLESRIERTLVLRGFEVFANRRVSNDNTGKAREMDLLAELHEILIPDGSPERPSVGAKLIVECINNRMPWAFLMKPLTREELVGCTTLLGTPLMLPASDGSSMKALLEDCCGVSWRTTLAEWSSQFCTFEPRGARDPSLRATQPQDCHSTLEKLIGESERVADAVMNADLIRAGFTSGWLSLVRPVIVLQGRIVAVTSHGPSLEVSDVSHVRYLRKGHIDGHGVAWVVDVVTENGFEGYLDWVQGAVHRVRRYCDEHGAVVRGAYADPAIRSASLLVPRGVR